jgi:two-component system response regulator PilR (NtrC family)
MKILMVDDDPDVSEVLELMLTQMGHDVTAVTEGKEAIARFARDSYDLVITDVFMPEISGWEVVEAVKQKSPETPVFLITGWGLQLDREQITRSGINGIINKPFSKQAISDEIARLSKGTR